VTEPAGTAPPSRLAWALRPRVALPVLTGLLVLAVLVTPQSAPIQPDLRLTTNSYSAGAASGIYDIARELGWRAERRTVPIAPDLDTGAVYAVLAPTNPITPPEAHALLDAVRGGAGLMYVVSDSGALEDSLQVNRSDSGFTMTRVPKAIASQCAHDNVENMLDWFREGVHLYRLVAHRAVTYDMPVFVTVDRPGPSAEHLPTEPAAFGFTLGRGRVVVYSDPDLLRNDVVRVCRWDIGRRVVESLNWVAGGRRQALVFDEYDQGYGSQPSMWRVSRQFLFGSVVGRAFAQATGAALVLMLALGVRPIPPRDVPRIERRSPLEHVTALARAYERINATRLVARRLAAGLRRRHGRGSWSARAAGIGASTGAGTSGGDADERFLSAVVAGHPEVAADAARILSAERAPIPASGLQALADAVDHIDHTFPTPKP
jgi:hypothetical protein